MIHDNAMMVGQAMGRLKTWCDAKRKRWYSHDRMGKDKHLVCLYEARGRGHYGFWVSDHEGLPFPEAVDHILHRAKTVPVEY